MKRYLTSLFLALATMPALLLPGSAEAVPAFARQTGQNCVACHAGGLFPELTPYGRIFKLTGYTIGERAMPLSIMGVLTGTKEKVNDPTAGKTLDGSLVFNTASLFIAGKVTDNIGGFAQITYNNYDSQNPDTLKWSGHSGSDNLDVRYADRFIDGDRDLIFGLTLHNNPTVQDVFNSAPAWGYGVVPGSTGAGGNVIGTILDGGLSQQVAGMGAYAYWNRTVYAELTGYKTGNGVFSFMTQGVNSDHTPQIYIKGANPYVRLALTKEWGPHNAMIGLTHLDVRQYSDQTNLSGPTDHYRDSGIDAQYQYILDPYTATATITRIHETIAPGMPSAGQLPDTVNSLRAKASFIYKSTYGTGLSYFNYSNSSNGLLSAQAGTRGWTPEVFWRPVQYVRLGLQYTAFDRVNGLSTNTDGAGRNAKDDNTLFFYVWGAY